MSCQSLYRELNLKEGAPLTEIKAAFRQMAKTCHPDAAGSGQADVEKFIKAQTAYKKLLQTALAHNRARRRPAQPKPARPEPPQPEPAQPEPAQPEPAQPSPRPNNNPAAEASAAHNYRLDERRKNGLDIICRLTVLRPAANADSTAAGLRLVLPALKQEACPRCLGQGRTLARLGQNGLYRPADCLKCNGRGSLDRETTLAVNLTPDQIGQSKIRLRRAGLYHAPSARRGDLILDIIWA